MIGQSGILDTARYQTFIAEALNVSVKDIRGLVLGGHGDTMVPLVDSTNVNGIPLSKMLDSDTIKKLLNVLERRSRNC